LMTSFSVGISFVSPALLGSISLLTDPKDQGLVLGTAQGNSSLGRIVGPLIGGFFYSGTHTFAFMVAAVIDVIAIAIVFSKRKFLPSGSK
jgi:MFS family permease